jgi:dTDP-4-dehydrorhamnose reductase
MQPSPPQLYHWSDAGEISWYDFAVEIQRQALALGLLTRSITLNAIGTADYPTPAKRPAYSVLDCQSLVQQLNRPQTPWQVNLQRVIAALATSPASFA